MDPQPLQHLPRPGPEPARTMKGYGHENLHTKPPNTPLAARSRARRRDAERRWRQDSRRRPAQLGPLFSIGKSSQTETGLQTSL